MATSESLRKNRRSYLLVATVLFDLVAILGLILFIIGFGQLSNVQSNVGASSPSNFLGVQWVPFWAQAIGTPFALLAFIAHAVILYFGKLRHQFWLKLIFGIVFTVLLVWLFAFAGGVLYDASRAVYDGTSPTSDWNVILAGSLLLTICGGMALVTTQMSIFPENDDY